MIDFTKTFKAEERKPFELIPDKTKLIGFVSKVEDWKTKTVTVKNRETGETTPNVEIANCSVHITIKDLKNHEYDGRVLRYNLTTHPNMGWNIPNFLNAVGVKECSLAELANVIMGKPVKVTVGVDTYMKKVVDKNTGIESEEERTFNSAKYVNPLSDDETDSWADMTASEVSEDDDF